MIKTHCAQRSFGDGLIAEEVKDLHEAWMKHADQLLGDPEIVAAVERVIAAAAAAGIQAGLGGERDQERQLAFIRRGVRFVTTQTDLGFLMAEASRRTEQIRKGLR